MSIGERTREFKPIEGDLLDAGPPTDVWAERAVIASIIIDPTRFPSVVELVTADDFSDTRCRLTFAAMKQLHDDHIPPDASLTIGMLDDRRQLDVLGDGSVEGPSVQWFKDLIDLLPAAINAVFYARRVKEVSRRRKAHYRGVSLIRGVGRASGRQGNRPRVRKPRIIA